MKEEKILEMASLILGILGLVIMLGAAMYDKNDLNSMAGLVGIIAFSYRQSVKKKNQKDS